ncbi:hypothetical protein EO93_13090 [Methanosarcina sp. 1.H.A.2.2]|nr:hypothetical protein EO93_13090 [Methanosarcina sp. 1.H.A.2.2]
MKDQEKGPFITGLLLDKGVWSSYSKVIAFVWLDLRAILFFQFPVTDSGPISIGSEKPETQQKIPNSFHAECKKS